MTASRQVHIKFFAVLREQAGVSALDVTTSARTPAELYAELTATRGLTLPATLLRVAINDRYATMDALLSPGNRVVFIPPVAGG